MISYSKKTRRLILFSLPIMLIGFILYSLSYEKGYQKQISPNWLTHTIPGIGYSDKWKLAIDKSGNLIVSGYEGGYTVFDGEYWMSSRIMESPLVNDVVVASDGAVWFATYGGITILQENNWTTFNTVNSSISSDKVGRIFLDSDDTAWMVVDGALNIFDGTTWQIYSAENSGLLGDITSGISIDSKGRGWMGTKAGLSVYEDGLWNSFTHENSNLPAGRILEVFVDSEDNVYMGIIEDKLFGERIGLTVFSNDQFITYTADDSKLADNGVNSIAQDHRGRIWIGTKSGVTVVDGSDWFTFTEFNSGLPSKSFAYELALDNDGIVWVLSGLNVSSLLDQDIRFASGDEEKVRQYIFSPSALAFWSVILVIIWTGFLIESYPGVIVAIAGSLLYLLIADPVSWLSRESSGIFDPHIFFGIAAGAAAIIGEMLVKTVKAPRSLGVILSLLAMTIAYILRMLSQFIGIYGI